MTSLHSHRKRTFGLTGLSLLLVTGLLIVGPIAVQAKTTGPCLLCSITGTNPAARGSTITYSLAGTCTGATSWTCSNGFVQSYTTTTATIVLGSSGTSALIQAHNPSGIQASLTVTLTAPVALSGGSITSTTFQIINQNTAPSQITATTASGGLCGSAWTYQWQSSTDNVTFSSISGTPAQGQNYQPGSVSQTTYYKRLTSCSGTNAYTSNTFTASVLLSGALTPTSQTINYNTTPLSLSVAPPTGGDGGPYSYGWYVNNVENETGRVGNAYNPGPLTSTTYYQVVTWDTYVGCGAGPAWIYVYPQLVAGTVSVPNSWINYDTPPGTLTVSPTGGSGAYTYQWWSNAGGTYQAITGAAGASYSPSVLTAATSYYVVVTSNGVSATTATATVNVYPPLVSGTISPSNQTIPYNTAGSLTVSGTTGGAGGYTYQWCSDASGTFLPLGPATGSSSYSTAALTATTNFEVITFSNGASVTSAPVTVTVTPPLTTGILTPASINMATGTNPGTLSCSPAFGGNCSGSYTYQWQSSPDGITWTTIGGVSGLTYSPGTLSSTVFYRVVAICGTDTVYSNAAQLTVGTIGSDWNFVRTRDLTRPGVTDTTTAAGLTDPNDVKQTTQYLDGLGRLIETVARQASPLEKDMVTMQVYDALGRETTKYLPYTSPSNDGNFKTDPYSEQSTFNATQFTGETYFYGQVNIEPSPLNRPLETFAPGSSWLGGNRGVSTGYLVATAADSVELWTINSTPETLPVASSTYPSGMLYKNTVTDENGHTVVEYKDEQGMVLLKKVQLWDNPAPGPSGWLNTYYVYDTLANLRFVIPPKAVEWLKVNSWNFAASGGSTVASELCFRYEYDYRKRMCIKKVPGAGEAWMVYDARDRLVMMQDSAMRRQHKWLFTRYDGMNRPDSTGLITDPGNYNNLAYHQGLAASSTSYPNLSSYSTEVLTQTFYDNYSAVSTAASLPLTTAGVNSANLVTTYNTAPVYAVAPIGHPISRGLPTGSMTKVIGTSSQYLYAETFYDDRGRSIQTCTVNYTGGHDTLTTQYDFSGKPIRTLLGQAKPTNTAQYHSVLTKTKYDPNFRVTSVWKNIDYAPSDQLIDSLKYNELGQLQTKYIGTDPATSAFMDSVVYDYNVRGWVTGINKAYVKGTASNYFGMELGYDNATSVSGTSYTSPSYNGNIAGTVWKSAGDGVDRKYDFSYDDVNRLTGAAYLDNYSGSWGKTTMDYTVSGLTYDPNGNILSMNQNGFKIGNPTGAIDQLTYSYQTNSNKLSQVNDAANDPSSVLGDFHFKGTKQAYDYSYDGNGSMVLDNNKSIDTIRYNYLNLPDTVHMNGKGNIIYTYDAAGAKLQKQTIDSVAGLATTILYLDGFQYQRRTPIASLSSGVDTLQFMGHEDGRARWAFLKHVAGDSTYAWEYDFVEKDHLGNTRVLLTQEKDTAQYIATMESAYRATEDALFYGIDSTSYARSNVAGYPVDLTITNPNDSVSRLNGNGPKTGPAIILKVMSGDKIDIGVQYYYNTMSNTNGPSLSPQNLLNSLASGLATLSAPAEASLSVLSNSTTSPLLAALTSSIGNETGTGTTKPQAYLNWVLLDNQFHYVAGSSGALQVGSAGTQSNGNLQPCLANNGISMSKSGYLYIYVSNATPGWDVFFDNLSVKHYSGPMQEENHYYPFGLTMAGISDKAIKTQYTQNKYRYNGKELQNQEFADGSGLEEYDFGARHYDPQIGRWHNLDPAADKLPQHSPFEYSINNPILFIDPNGQFPYPIHIRSFAPFPTFGGGFAGDNRGWSTTLGAKEVAGGVTSRMQQAFTVDPSQRSVTGLSTWSDPSHHSVFGTATAKDNADVEAGYKSGAGANVAVVTSNMAASNPLVPGSPDIDIHSTIRLTENLKNASLNIQMSMNGDRFPAAEAFIGDTKGQQLFIGVSGYDGSAFTSLPGNNDRPMFYANFDVKINDKGEFVAVVSGGQTYTVAAWNKRIQATPLEYQKPKSSGSSVQADDQGGGCRGNGCALFEEMYQKAMENMPIKH